MQRNKIKADGTVYAIKDGGWSCPGRIVETARLWDEEVNRRSVNRKTVSGRGVMSRSTSNPDNWYSWYTYTGFLAVVGQRHADADNVALLAGLEIPTPGDSDWLSAWEESLPEGLSVRVMVSKDVLDTWDAYQETEKAERVARDAENKRRQEENDRHRTIRTQVDALLETHGLRQRYGGLPGHVNITLDAEDFMALIERLTSGDTRQEKS